MIINQDKYEVTQIYKNIYMGGAPPINSHIDEQFDSLFLMAMEYQIGNKWDDMAVYFYPIDDNYNGVTRIERHFINEASDYAIKDAMDGKKVLITCMEGRNRSGVVTALTLVKGFG